MTESTDEKEYDRHTAERHHNEMMSVLVSIDASLIKLVEIKDKEED